MGLMAFDKFSVNSDELETFIKMICDPYHMFNIRLADSITINSRDIFAYYIVNGSVDFKLYKRDSPSSYVTVDISAKNTNSMIQIGLFTVLINREIEELYDKIKEMIKETKFIKNIGFYDG